MLWIPYDEWRWRRRTEFVRHVSYPFSGTPQLPVLAKSGGQRALEGAENEAEGCVE